MTRPRLAEAPAAVREAVKELLGARVQTEQPAQGGFTPSIASVVVGRGSRLFVKAAPLGMGVEVGAALAEAVGEIGPRLVGFRVVGDWRVAAYEVIEGAAVRQWAAEDVPRLLSLIDRWRVRAAACRVNGATPYADAFRPMLGAWQGSAVPGPPLPVSIALPVLAELERRWLSVLRPGTALHHGDLRRDNFMREPDGRLRIVDWTHLWTAPGWMDLVRLLPDVAACGFDPEELLRRSCWADAPAEDVNVALAGLAGRAWRDGHRPGDPALRRMQREQAYQLLGWLASRVP
ncbi:phosphotransferase [Actinoplanes sp. Pm04-4]|uniref:Phosphotransferase n=1 Tax=Paractinoplanes pyxinae TaxID=2997416 RepID=A0ABT4BER3_9ACTN|nr:phosphotransferase [Actinoplanes pyxinae]MCY1145019.1 phosphotransferase [Actinoplanes pyxinae]